jgi:threonine synthase
MRLVRQDIPERRAAAALALLRAPLLARYDLAGLRGIFTLAALRARVPTLWRYAEVLPVRDPAFALTLGEGFTPMLDAPRLANCLGASSGSRMKGRIRPAASARGLAVAVRVRGRRA